jgi:hypothetical protein
MDEQPDNDEIAEELQKWLDSAKQNATPEIPDFSNIKGLALFGHDVDSTDQPTLNRILAFCTLNQAIFNAQSVNLSKIQDNSVTLLAEADKMRVDILSAMSARITNLENTIIELRSSNKRRFDWIDWIFLAIVAVLISAQFV